MNFVRGEELLAICEERGWSVAEAMRNREREYLEQDPVEMEGSMRKVWSIMEDALQKAMEGGISTMGGYIGGEALKLEGRRKAGISACGGVVSRAIACACGMLEVNGAMGLIVAAPTAGASGVLPSVLTALKEEWKLEEEEILDGLFNAGAIGYLFTRNATVAGAEGGCQAEVGVASAMAASAAVQLLGGTPAQCLNAAAIAITNILGLVCDPVAGLVETPCQQRNAMGAANALVAAEMSLAGIQNAAPFDECVSMMYQVGKSLPAALRETAMGGLAACACFRGGKS